MAREKVSLVATLPDGSEYFDDITCYSRNGLDTSDYLGFARAAVRNAGLITPRNDPKSINVKIQTITLEKGQMKRSYGSDFSVPLPLERMTQADFDADMNLILNSVPPEFQAYVRTTSWDRGHSSGFEEVASIAEDIVDALRPCILEYNKRLRKDGPPKE